MFWFPLWQRLFLLTFAAVVLPSRQIEIVPVWQVQVLDEAGEPVPNLEVREGWEFYGVGPTPDGDTARTTDSDGRVVFSAQTFRGSLVGLLFSRIITLLNVHASFGPSGSVSSLPHGFKAGRSHYATDGKIYDGQTPLASIQERKDTPKVNQLRDPLSKAAAKKPAAQP